VGAPPSAKEQPLFVAALLRLQGVDIPLLARIFENRESAIRVGAETSLIYFVVIRSFTAGFSSTVMSLYSSTSPPV
jgi:hypothetical protein